MTEGQNIYPFISLYNSAVYSIQNAGLSFGLYASIEMLHKLEKGNMIKS